MNETEMRKRISLLATEALLADLVEEFQDEDVAHMALLATKVHMLLAPMHTLPPCHSTLVLTLEELGRIANIPLTTKDERQALINRAAAWAKRFDTAAQEALRSLQLAGEA